MSAALLVIIFISVALVINAFYWYLGIWSKSFKYNQHGYMLPPGFVIGIVWTVLFGFMGYALWVLYDDNDGKSSTASVFLLIFVGYCILYPLLAYQSEAVARIANYVALILLIITIILILAQCYEINSPLNAFWYLIPVLLWLVYVNFTDVLYLNVLEKARKFIM